MAEALEWVARITSKGRVTIPAEMRRELGIRYGDSLIFRSGDGVVTIASARKPTLANLLAGFDPAKHRHKPEERRWDDARRGRAIAYNVPLPSGERIGEGEMPSAILQTAHRCVCKPPHPALSPPEGFAQFVFP